MDGEFCDDISSVFVRVWFMMFNATFNNISVISWWLCKAEINNISFSSLIKDLYVDYLNFEEI